MSLTRRLILQKKARHHPPTTTSRALTDCKRTVSGTLSLPSRGGTFSPFPHGTNPLSVTEKYSGLPGGPGRFTADSTGPLLLGNSSTGAVMFFSVTGLSPTTADHPRPLHLTPRFITPAPPAGRPKTKRPTTPHTQPPLPSITCIRFSHPPRSLATTNGITIVFFSSYGY